MTRPAADFTIDEDKGVTELTPIGEWTIWTMETVQDRLRDAIGDAPLQLGALRLNLDKLSRLDMAGALTLTRLHAGCFDENQMVGGADALRQLIQTVDARELPKPPPPETGYGVGKLLERAGRGVESAAKELLEILSFLGEVLVVIFRVITQPWRLRWTSLFHFMEETGVNAIPIIAVLSFFVGAVIAFIGANLLGRFAFSIFTVELVGFAVLREFGVVIMAILLAGRSDSAFTAQIGAMKMREEIDALEVMGVDPMEALVAPRVIAIVIMAPMLCFVSIASGLIGGLLTCWGFVDITPQLFITRMAETVAIDHFWVGMVKAPVFAFLVAISGCRHGLAVEGDVQSLGHRTTQSVVESIFLVIVTDALFALLFLELNI